MSSEYQRIANDLRGTACKDIYVWPFLGACDVLVYELHRLKIFFLFINLLTSTIIWGGLKYYNTNATFLKSLKYLYYIISPKSI